MVLGTAELWWGGMLYPPHPTPPHCILVHTGGWIVKGELYIEQVRKVIDSLETTQMKAIERAAEMITECLQNGGLIHIFGAGHSHIFAEELSFRAGGLLTVDPILDTGYMLYGGTRRGMRLEKLPGFASIVLDNHDVRPGEVLVVVSTSGKNQGPLEMALQAKEKGLIVIAITSLEYAQGVESEHPSGKKLYEVADLTIDNRVPRGDASVEIAPDLPKAGPLSTVACATILNAIVTEVAFTLHNRGITPPIAKSVNVPGGPEYNRRIETAYAHVLKRIKWA